jgi:glycosyltransferase involved in cell wall biosynthesis
MHAFVGNLILSNQARQMECRLLYVVGQLGLGGLERQLFYLIQSMDRERYKPAVVVWSNSHDAHYIQEIIALNVPVLALGSKKTRSAKLRALRNLVFAVRPEVIHSYTFYTNIAAWWAARGTATIPIGSIRSNFVLDRLESGKVLGRLCGRWPSAQIFNSLTAEQAARQSTNLFRPRRTYVIRNGVDIVRFSPRCHPQQGYILAVGSLYPVKRWDRLIRAVSFLTSKGICPEVIHVGSGPLRGELEAMTKSLHVEHVVRFLGAQQDIPALLGDAAFLVHTAEADGCPNVVLEAMACGRAIVATDAGDVPHLIDDGKTGFVVPREDDVALTSRIAALLADRELCRQMGDAGRIKAEGAFGIERLRSETFAAYRAEGWRDH